jgi:hypothetical protein
MTDTSLILQPPTPAMLQSSDALYKFLLELWNRSGGYKQSSQDLTGLKVSVPELNTLQGIRLDNTVQAQLNGKESAVTLGDMAYQSANNINIIGGRVSNIELNQSNIDASSEDNCIYKNVDIVSGIIRGADIYITTGSSNSAFAIGILFRDFSSHACNAVTETDLSLYSLLANTLNTDNDFIEIIGFGTFAANANNKRIKLVIGATTIYDTTALAVNSGAWKITAIISRVSSVLQKCIIEISAETAVLTNSATYITSAENLATNLNVKFTGTGVAGSDIVQEGMIVNYYRG